MIVVEDLHKRFGHHDVLKGLSLRVEKGQFVTVFGPNGAGKTTLIRIISTLARGRGKVMVNGHDLEEEAHEARASIGVLSHDTFLYDELTASENLVFYGRMYGLDPPRARARANELLADVGLTLRADERVGTFSRGMKQRVAIARAIIHDPPVLLFDEPYSGLDPSAAGVLSGLLKRLHTGERSIVMTTHNIERGLELCDRVAVLCKGRLVHEGAPRPREEFEPLYYELVGDGRDAGKGRDSGRAEK